MNKKIKAGVVAGFATLAVALAGCGGHSTGHHATDYGSPRALAKALGCSGSYQPQPDAAVSGKAGVCTFEGEQVTEIVAGSPDKRDADVESARKIAKAFGTSPAYAVVGGSWAVLTESRDVANDAATRVGGTVESPKSP